MIHKAYFFLIFGVSLLLLGCTIKPGTTDQSNATIVEQTKYVCPNGNVVTTADGCANASATVLTTEEQLSVCKGMPEVQGVSLEDACIEGIAAKNRDASICQEVARDLRPTCYALVAVAKNDVNVCVDAGSSKDRCYDEYARNTQDITACDKITEVNNKDSCYFNIFNIAGDVTICGKMANVNQKNSCYWNAATRFQNAAYCNQITNTDQKNNCLQQVSGNSGNTGPSQPPKPEQPVQPQ